MMARREFTKAVYAQIVHRASVSGQIACEGCGLVLGKKPYHVDHTIADGLQIDKSRKLTADDGKLLGVECCHDVLPPGHRQGQAPGGKTSRHHQAGRHPEIRWLPDIRKIRRAPAEAGFTVSVTL